MGRLKRIEEKLDRLAKALEAQEKLVGFYEGIIRRLEEQNKELMDRFLARDLPELKTFTLPEVPVGTIPEVSLEENEDLAGEAFSVES